MTPLHQDIAMDGAMSTPRPCASMRTPWPSRQAGLNLREACVRWRWPKRGFWTTVTTPPTWPMPATTCPMSAASAKRARGATPCAGTEPEFVQGTALLWLDPTDDGQRPGRDRAAAAGAARQPTGPESRSRSVGAGAMPSSSTASWTGRWRPCRRPTSRRRPSASPRPGGPGAWPVWADATRRGCGRRRPAVRPGPKAARGQAL